MAGAYWHWQAPETPQKERVVDAKIRLASIVLAAATASFAAAGKAEDGQEVTVRGCAAEGVESRCLILKGEDGTVYDISSARPRPQTFGRAISLTGVKSDKLGICQQGVILDRIKWSYTTRTC